MDTIQFLDSRPTPTTTPSAVAAMIPPMASRMVLTMPTHRARPPVSGLVSIPSDRSMPGSTPKKSNPVGMFLASSSCPARVVRKNRAPSTSSSVATWVSHLTTTASR